MPLRSACSCTLCALETCLLRNLSTTDEDGFSDLAESVQLLNLSCPHDLLAPLRSSPADARSDKLLRDLLKTRAARPAFVESLLTLTFVPMLHRAIRRVLLFQPALAEEDVTQQALIFLLQIVRSGEMQTRQSHFAFAISRAVKRQLFEWAQREGKKHAPLNSGSNIWSSLIIEDSFERHAQLRHFLHRCVRRGDLTSAELDLLVQFKLEANHQEDFELSNGHSSNALRQKLKRLLAKLRRLAR